MDWLSWLIAALLVFGIAYAVFLLRMRRSSCPFDKSVEFVARSSEADFEVAFCTHLGHLRWLMPKQTFQERFEASGRDCLGRPVGVPVSSDFEKIYVVRDCASGYAANSDLKDGVRIIQLCPSELDLESFPHEYIHHRRGHVCLPKDLLTNIFADFQVKAEISARLIARLPWFARYLLLRRSSTRQRDIAGVPVSQVPSTAPHLTLAMCDTSFSDE